MIKIFPLGKNLRAYLDKYRENRPHLAFTCENEDCNNRVLYEHGSYNRTAVFKHDQFKLPIYRWRCPQCGKTLSALPDFLVPGGHFATPIREAALKRRKSGESLKQIAKSVVTVKAGSISTKTIKRWWKQHLDKAGEVTQWLAGELIRSGVNDDLLRLHSQGVNPTPIDTLQWLTTLVQKYFQRLGLRQPLMGYFGFINTRLPSSIWL